MFKHIIMCEINQVDLIKTDLLNMSKHSCLLFVLIIVAAMMMNKGPNIFFFQQTLV